MSAGDQRVKFTLTIHMETTVPGHWDERMVRFHLEENHCNGNHIEELYQWTLDHQNLCSVCNHSEVHVDEFGLPLLEPENPPQKHEWEVSRRRWDTAEAEQSVVTALLAGVDAAIGSPRPVDWLAGTEALAWIRSELNAMRAELRYHRANADLAKDALDDREHLETGAAALVEILESWSKREPRAMTITSKSWLENERVRVGRGPR